MFKNRYAKFDPNIPRGSRVMSIFTNRPEPAEMMRLSTSGPIESKKEGKDQETTQSSTTPDPG